MTFSPWFTAALLGVALFQPLYAVEPWATYRGNPQRTGNTDGNGNLVAPKILWAYKTTDNYIASPVPLGDSLFVSGLGAFNVGNFACLNNDPGAQKRVRWAKTTPLLKLPTVSSPALLGGKIIFGDGMHQTDGATLFCMNAERGLPVWQYPVPGHLVHLEGAPTIDGGHAYIGGGAAGVLCIDINSVTLDGQALDPAAIQKILDARWRELQAKYEVDKKKDPDFAVPPSEDQLPAARPRLRWQQGKDKWHVDAPVTVAGNRVLVCSSFLDLEKLGDRALMCLDGGSGEVIWRKSLKLNPWGGASVSAGQVIVTGSSIGYYPGALKGAKGMIAAFDLATGHEQWSKDITGGIVGCAALADGAAFVTATDGKIRAFELVDGERRWIYDSKTPYFAPVAIAGTSVYAGDLKGMLHALDLKTGTKQWDLDLGTAPETKAPGMVYGGPIIHAGRLYVATCNLEGPFARQPCVVVAIGAK